MSTEWIISSEPDAWPASEVLAFVDQARQFCDFVEKAGDYPLVPRLSAARQRLLELYRTGSALPQVEPPEGIDAGPNPERPRTWVGFDQFEFYWEVFDPYVDEAPVTGSLSDDLLDVYFDLRRGLELWDKDVPRAAAIWEWRFHFDAHWGDHAIDALRALHRACRAAGSSTMPSSSEVDSSSGNTRRTPNVPRDRGRDEAPMPETAGADFGDALTS